MLISNSLRRVPKVLPAVAASLVLATFAESSHAISQNVGSVTFTRLCPTHVGGDREFDGHGPVVDSQVTLRRASAREQFLLDITLHERETEPDWTEASLVRTFSLGTSPAGRPYTFIWAPASGGAFQWVALGSNLTYASAAINYIDNDHAEDQFLNVRWWLSEVAIKGDTGGNDVGNCTTDDAYITVRLPAIWVWHD